MISKITRLVVISDKGRLLDMDKLKINQELQDDGKTLKIFIKEKQ